MSLNTSDSKKNDDTFLNFILNILKIYNSH